MSVPWILDRIGMSPDRRTGSRLGPEKSWTSVLIETLMSRAAGRVIDVFLEFRVSPWSLAIFSASSLPEGDTIITAFSMGANDSLVEKTVCSSFGPTFVCQGIFQNSA